MRARERGSSVDLEAFGLELGGVEGVGGDNLDGEGDITLNEPAVSTSDGDSVRRYAAESDTKKNHKRLSSFGGARVYQQ